MRKVAISRWRIPEFKKLMQGDGALRNTLLTGLAEVIGSAMLILIGCMGCVGSFGVAPPHFQISLTFGLAVLIVIQCIGHISDAHINPAITVGAVVLGKKTIPQACVYLLSQLAGGVLGFGILKIVTPAGHLHGGAPETASSFCTTDLHGHLSAMQGLMLEGVSTAILMMVASAIWDKRNANNTDSIAIKFGLTVAALAMAFGPYTGCSMNPARSFAPAVWNNHWRHQWVYWFGPIGGALLSSFMYKTVFGLKGDEDEPPAPEAVALNSVETQKTEQP